MRLICTLSLIFSLLVCCSDSLTGQTQFWSDDFEDPSNPSSGIRTPSNNGGNADNPFSAYFLRTQGDNIELSLISDGPYTSKQGSWFWAGEDHDGPFGNPEQSITWTNINIAGKSEISFSGLFAAQSTNPAWDHVLFTNSHTDYLIVEYSIDGGAYVSLLPFYSNQIPEKQLALDTDGDTLGDGVILTKDFTEVSADIPGTGNTLSIRIRVYSNNTYTEEWAIDNFRLFEAPSCIPPVITANPPNRTICVGGNTTFTMAATGATAYQWQVNTGSGFSNITNGGVYSGATTTTLTITGATSGMTGYQYRCMAINGDLSCFTNTNVGTLTVSNVQLSSSSSNVSCNGGSNGTASVTPSGGISPYTYLWSNGTTGSSISGVPAGSYSVTVTDNIGCNAVNNFTITQPTALVVSQNSQTNVSCNGGANGAASVSVSGGTPGYTYNWTPGNPSGDGTNSVTGLTAGTWTCEVTDANGCTESFEFNISQPSIISFTSLSQTNIACNGEATGAASVNPATGGAGGFSYDWTPGTPTGDGTTSISGLTAGTWTATATDANSCTATVNFTITQPPALILTPASQTDIACNGEATGMASVNAATGGTGSYTYDWTPGNPTGDGTTTISGLTAGTWTCEVTDENGCTSSQSFTITEPAALVVTQNTQTDVSCNGGSNGTASVSVTGGTSGYTYNWTPGNPTGDGTSSVTGLTPGVWTCEVTDANGCTGSVSITINEPSAINLTPSSQTNIACNGEATGAASINPATGGTAPYTYDWAPGIPMGDGTTSVTGLVAGTWTVTVIDNNFCQNSLSFTITQPPALTLTPLGQTNVSCNGGSNGTASVNVASGGTPNYTYDWSPGTPTGDGTTSVSGLTAGTWTCEVTDANGCTTSQSFTITQPTLLNITSTTQSNVSCNGGSNGAASVNVTGGTGTYAYDWTPGNPTGEGTSSVTGLTAGTWTCTVFDVNGCTTSTSFTITQPTSFDITTEQSDVTCNGGSDGSASVVVNGATAPYTYVWSPTGGTLPVATGLSAGTYSVVITDSNGCQTTANFTIQENAVYSVSSSQTDVTCHGGSDGSAEVEVSGMTGPYTYLWSPGGGTDASESGLTAGDYSVTVEDSEGCAQTVLFTIDEPDAYVVIPSQVNQSCPNETDGEAGVIVTGNTPPYTYIWSNGAITSQITNLESGIYTLTISDSNMCDTIVTFNILLEDDVLITYYEDADGDGFGNPEESIIICGSPPFGYVDNSLDCDDTDPEIYLGAIDIDCIDNQMVDAFEGECFYVHEGTNWDATGGYSCTTEEIYYDLSGATSGTGSSLDGVSFAVGETTVTWTINVSGLNPVSCSFTVIVEDNELPTISCSDNQMTYTNPGLCTYTHDDNLWDAQATDNCGIANLSYELSGATTGSGTTLAGVTFEIGTTSVLWTIEDENGNFNDCIFTVTVEDNEVPMLLCAETQLVDTDAGVCSYMHAGIDWDASEDDNCGVLSITYELEGATVGTGTSLDGIVFELGETQVTWTIEDENGNFNECSFTVMVEDNEIPMILCTETQLVDTDAGVCSYTHTGAGWDATGDDNCGIENISYELSGATTGTGTTLDGVIFELGETEVTWTIEDENGNFDDCSFTVIVEDNETPSILCSENLLVETDLGVCTYTHLGNDWDADATDNCGELTLMYELSGATTGTGTSLDGVIFELGETEVTWTIEDESGNLNECSFTVTIADNELPQILCSESQLVNTDEGACSYTHEGSDWNASGIDNCGVSSIEFELSGASTGTGTSLDGVTFELGETIVTWTIEDLNGNFNECSYTITVEDNELPEISCVADQVIDSDDSVCTYLQIGDGWDAIATDNCGIESLGYSLSGTTTGTGISLDGVLFNTGITVVTWTVIDENGNMNSCSFEVSVGSSIGPDVECAGDNGELTVAMDEGVCTYTAIEGFLDPIATHPCDQIMTITHNYDSAPDPNTLDGAVFPLGSTLIIWTIEDESGNIVNCSVELIVEDNELPLIMCSEDQLVDTDPGVCTYTHSGDEWDASGTDNCGLESIEFELSGATSGEGTSLDGFVFELGETFVTWTIIDDNGNVDSCAYTIIVEDIELPIFPRPSDMSMSTEGGATCPETVDISIAIDRDNPIATNNEAFTFFVHGIEVSGPTVYSDNCSMGENLELYVWNLIEDWNGVGNACERQIRVTWRVMDEAGNFQNRQQIFTITDDTAPVVEAPEDESYSCYNDVPLDVVLTAEDNCAGEITVTGVDVDNGGAGCTGDPLVITRTWTFNDGCGNITEVSQTITVIDDINPEIVSEATNLTVECDGGGNVAQFNDWLASRGGFEGLDNCSSLTYTTNPALPVLSNLCGATGAVTVTFIATDECGNSSESTATFTIEDTIAPDLSTCPSTDLTIECNSSENENNAINWNAANIQTLLSCATDECSESLTVNSDFDWANYVPSCGDAGQITVNYQVVDECNNISETYTSVLTIENTTPPVVIIEDELFAQGYNGTVVIEGNPNVEGWEYPTLTLDEISANGNCGSVDLSLEEYFVIEDDCEESGFLMEHFYTITAIDECGNTTVVTVTLRVVDTTAPVIYGVPEDVTVTCGSIEECPGGGVCDIFAPAEIFFDDNCDCGLFDYEEIITNQTCAYNYDVVRRWTARDKCGNETIEEQVISVRDETAPILQFDNPLLADIENGSEILVDCESWGLPQWVKDIEAAGISAVDDCMGEVEVDYERIVENGFQCTTDGYFDKITYTWNAEDACGNESEFSFAILLTDNSPPQIVGPASTCDDNPDNSGLEVIETCSDIVYWEYEDKTGIDEECGGDVIYRTWLAADACNNFAEFVQRIYIDRPAPILVVEDQNLPPNQDNVIEVRLDCDDENTIDWYRNLTVKVKPSCGGIPEIVYTEQEMVSPDCNDGIAKTIRMVWSARNDCGNETQFIVIVELEDVSRPFFANNPAQIFSECGEEIPMPNVVDGCSQVEIILLSQDTLSILGTCNNKMTLSQRFEARDLCGNTARFSRRVRIVDTQGPEFVNVRETICVGEEIEAPEVVDACGESEIILTFEEVNNDCLLYNSTTRIWRAEDGCGNVSYFEQTIMIDDNFGDIAINNPLIGAIENGGVYTVNCSTLPEEIGDVFNANDVVGAADCVSLKVDVKIRLEDEGNCVVDGYLYNFEVSYIISHDCMGTKEYRINLFVEDDEAPIFIYAPEDVEMYCEGEEGLLDAEIEDACGEYTLEYSVERFGSETDIEEGNYRMLRRWIVTDRCGNSSSHTQDVRFYHYEVEGRIELVNSPVCNSLRNFATAEVDFGTGPFIYEWTVLNGECEILGDRTAKTINYRIGFTPVTLQVRIIDSFGCETTAEITFVCESIESRESIDDTLEESREMVLYPNPTKGRFMLEWTNESDTEEVEIRIYGVRGEIHEIRQAKQMKGLNKLEFMNNGIAPGVYHLEMIEGEKVWNKRFIVID